MRTTSLRPGCSNGKLPGGRVWHQMQASCAHRSRLRRDLTRWAASDRPPWHAAASVHHEVHNTPRHQALGPGTDRAIGSCFAGGGFLDAPPASSSSARRCAKEDRPAAAR
eukprot:7097469-Prymnesium_polylepis.2